MSRRAKLCRGPTCLRARFTLRYYPVEALEQIGQLHLLGALFDTVIVPVAVVEETSISVVLPAWIEQQALTQSVGPLIMKASLGAGESEAISLALELEARLGAVKE